MTSVCSDMTLLFGHFSFLTFSMAPVPMRSAKVEAGVIAQLILQTWTQQTHLKAERNDARAYIGVGSLCSV